MKNDMMRARELKSSAARLAIIASLAAWGGSAHSQATSAGASQAPPENTLTEIVVTAQKRATFIQDTPIAMDAFRATDVRSANVSDVVGLTRLAPDLQMIQTNSAIQFSIRGVTSLDVSNAGDPALTVNIDGEYINSGIAVNAALFDLERVEVLRGPQGTLYGRNATAGAINLIAAKPTFAGVNGFITAGYGNFDAKHLEAAVNLPVSDKVAVRAAVFHNDHQGYRDNGSAGRGDNANTTAVRLSALAKPTDRLTAYVAGEYVNVDQTGVAQYGVPIGSSTPGLTSYTNPDNSTQSSLVPSKSTFSYNPSRFPLDTLGYYKSLQYAVRGRLDYDFGPATLSYLGGYRDIRSRQLQEVDGLASGGGVHYDVYTPHQDSDTQSHELRLSSNPKSPLIWQAGFFYFKETQNIAQELYSPNFQFFPGFPPNGVGVNVITTYRPNADATSKAAFGQVTIPIISDTLSVTGGLRYTSDDKRSDFVSCPFSIQSNVNALPGTNCAGGARTVQKFSGSKLTWSTGVDWHPAPHHLIYGKISEGYKAGGFDNAGSYGPETLLAYEIGSKNEFLEKRLQFNASAFYYDYTNQQVTILVNETVGFATQNAGASRIYGLETDTHYQLTPNDHISLTANYLDAKFTKYKGQYDTLSGTAFPADLSGKQPPLAPKVVVAFGYDHVFDLPNAGTLTANATVRYTSSYFLTVTNWAADKVNAFAKTDLGAEYNSPDRTVAVRAYVHNLENHIVATYAAYISPPGEYVFEFSEPRTYGLQVTKKF